MWGYKSGYPYGGALAYAHDAATDTAVKAAKASDKLLKLFDAGGLFLLVTPAGGKLWRLKYRFKEKEKLLALGTYPEVPLAGKEDKETGLRIDGARDKRDQAKRLFAANVDPGEVRQAQKAAKATAGQNTFKALVLEWHTKWKGRWSEGTAKTKLNRLNADVFPLIGGKPIAELRRLDVLGVLNPIIERGSLDVVHRVRHMMDQIFRYAIATGRGELNPATGL